MIKLKSQLFVLLFLGSLTSYSQQKAVFILLDGIPADVIEKVNTPTMDEIGGMGGYARAFVGGEIGKKTETPTISGPGYMTLITGTWGNKHNVWGNSIKAPNYDYWNIFRIVKMANPKSTMAIFSTWEDNRTKLIGEGIPEAGGLTLDYSFDGFENDEESFPHDDGRKYLFNIDEHVSKEAERYISAEGPDISWVYLEFTDAMGHKFGDSQEMYDAVKKADVQVGRIWSAVKSRMKNYPENWMMVITTDHGRSADDGKGHGGQSERERTTWIVTNASNLEPSFYENPPIVDILPSILDHLGVAPPPEINAQFDGKSFIKTR